MRINRLFELVFLLLEKNGLTSQELAGHFGVVARTIWRDVGLLKKAGIPVTVKQGMYGGVFIEENALVSRVLASPEERMRILVTLQAKSATRADGTERVLQYLRGLFK